MFHPVQHVSFFDSRAYAYAPAPKVKRMAQSPPSISWGQVKVYQQLGNNPTLRGSDGR